jgi:hypothetical protein
MCVPWATHTLACLWESSLPYMANSQVLQTQVSAPSTQHVTVGKSHDLSTPNGPHVPLGKQSPDQSPDHRRIYALTRPHEGTCRVYKTKVTNAVTLGRVRPWDNSHKHSKGSHTREKNPADIPHGIIRGNNPIG